MMRRRGVMRRTPHMLISRGCWGVRGVGRVRRRKPSAGGGGDMAPLCRGGRDWTAPGMRTRRRRWFSIWRWFGGARIPAWVRWRSVGWRWRSHPSVTSSRVSIVLRSIWGRRLETRSGPT